MEIVLAFEFSVLQYLEQAGLTEALQSTLRQEDGGPIILQVKHARILNGDHIDATSTCSVSLVPHTPEVEKLSAAGQWLGGCTCMPCFWLDSAPRSR